MSHIAFPFLRRLLSLRRLLLPLAGTLLLLACSEKNENSELLIRGETMGTTYSVRIDLSPSAASRSAEVEKELKRALEEELHRINMIFSTWEENSEISRFNRHPAGTPFSASREFLELLDLSREIHRETNGKFDPTLGPLIELWGFGKSTGLTWPAPEEIRKARESVGFSRIRLTHHTAQRDHPRLQLNLSAVAKGYGVDRLYALLRKRGYSSVLVEVGGEIRAGLPPRRAESWKIGVERPHYDGERELFGVLEIRELSVATSGDYRNFFMHENRRYSHILDPTTGKPVTTGIVSVTVLGPSCARADALATSLMVLPPGRGTALLKKEKGYEGLILVEEPGGKLREYSTAGFHDYFKRLNRSP